MTNHRRSLRLTGYDYAQPGAYFVTIAAWGREAVFGEICSGLMHLNPYGTVAETELRTLPRRFPTTRLDDFIVMPDHVHFILEIHEIRDGRQGATQPSGQGAAAGTFPLKPGTLGAFVGAYKTRTARLINSLRRTPGEPVWQRNYHDRIICSDAEWAGFQAYIINNPLEWVQARGDSEPGAG